MKTADLAHETYTALSANKVRSMLTMLGIVIGIASVITMVSIGQGAQSSIQDNIQALGANLIQISPGAQSTRGFGVSQGRGSAQTLTADDADAILLEVDNVVAISPETSSRYQVTAKGTNTNTTVAGVLSSYPTVRNIAIADGAFISDTHNNSGAKVAVLGPTTRDDLFGEGVDAIGQSIRINSIQFKVIGVTEVKGGSGFTNQDDMIFIPLKTAQRYLTGNEYVSSINVQASSGNAMEQVAADATNLLLARHNISDATQADFSVLNQEDLISTVSSVTETFTVLLAAVAGISLVVGGIGIMNMMLTTVTERTREIGLRKAIGATRADISNQFLAESIALTLIGGSVGVLLGIGLAIGLDRFEVTTTTVSFSSVALAFGVSAIIGVVFGWYPARQASRLNPIDALRYE